MLSFVPSLALLPIRTRPYRHPTGEPGEMDGRLNVSRKWQAPLGSGTGFLLLGLLLWDVALESGPHVFPSVCCGSQSGGRGRGQANRTCTAASVPVPTLGRWCSLEDSTREVGTCTSCFPAAAVPSPTWGCGGHSVPVPPRSAVFSRLSARGDFISDLPVSVLLPACRHETAAVPSFPGTAPAPQLL